MLRGRRPAVHRRALEWHPSNLRADPEAFLTGIADGTLPRSHFQFYLTQDAKYLRVFGDVLSVLAAKAPRVEWAILLNQHAINSVKEERTLHESILRSYGVGKLTPAFRRIRLCYQVGVAAV